MSRRIYDRRSYTITVERSERRASVDAEREALRRERLAAVALDLRDETLVALLVGQLPQVERNIYRAEAERRGLL